MATTRNALRKDFAETDFGKLPPEIILAIYLHLNKKSTVSLSVTCVTLRVIAAHNHKTRDVLIHVKNEIAAKEFAAERERINRQYGCLSRPFAFFTGTNERFSTTVSSWDRKTYS